MIKPKYLISACLVGQNTKYDGTNNYNDLIANLYKDGAGVLICPEVMGGLETPRVPCEVVGTSVLNKNSEDKTKEFIDGASKSLDLANKFNIKRAILKSKSPSCGYKQIYDGTFSNKLKDGNGITTSLLINSGFKIYDENTKPCYDAIVLCAGDSNRCKINYNKVFHYCSDHNVVEQALAPFIFDIYCNQVIIVAKESEIPYFEPFVTSSKVKYVIGGASREESVKNGLKAVNMPIVLIHDGDRPYLSYDLVDNIVEQMINGSDNCVPYIEKLDNTRDYCVENKSIQTPQAYKTDVLIKKVNEIDDLSKYRDESSMFNSINYVKGEENNKKITFYEDLKEFEEINKK